MYFNMKICDYVIVAIVLLLISPCSCPNTLRKKMKCDKEFTYESAAGNNLTEEFKRCNSWGTSIKNFCTLQWFDALKWLRVKQMRELCVCFHLKINSNESEVEVYENKPEKKDSDYADYHYSELEKGSKNKVWRVYSCSEYFNTGIILLSGCSSYGLFNKKYDVYEISAVLNGMNVVGVGRKIPL